MARIRTIKPELAAHEGLYDLERETGLPIRFAWAMLFTACDREGRFKWQPRTLKTQILPHDDLDFSRVLDAWLTRGYIVKYRVGNSWFAYIPTFLRHQVINHRESASQVPAPSTADETIDHTNQQNANACATLEARDDDACGTRAGHARVEGKGREGEEGASTTRAPRVKANGKHRHPFSLPDWIPTDAWTAYEDMRRRVKKPMTDRARELAIVEIDRLRGEGHDPRAVLEQSVLNSWQGIFPIREGQKGNGPSAEYDPKRMHI